MAPSPVGKLGDSFPAGKRDLTRRSVNRFLAPARWFDRPTASGGRGWIVGQLGCVDAPTDRRPAEEPRRCVNRTMAFILFYFLRRVCLCLWLQTRRRGRVKRFQVQQIIFILRLVPPVHPAVWKQIRLWRWERGKGGDLWMDGQSFLCVFNSSIYTNL